MAKPARIVTTVTVIGSNPAVTASGATALILTTREAGQIAFEVNETAIAAIREALVDCETRLRQPHGNA